MPELLIELFSEEIPARMQSGASENLRKMMTDGLVEAGLTYASAAAFATPRRLALVVEDLTDASPTTTEERRGPRTDAPQKAIDGFLRSTGLSLDQLETAEDKKGPVYIARITQEGRPADVIVAEVLEATIRNFPWPKSMRWGAGSLKWVRPLHSILAILSDETGTRTIPVELDDIPSGNSTAGHRFHAPGRFAVSSFEDYEAKLAHANVVLRPESRQETILAAAQNLAFAQGMELVDDPALLREVAGLVEWPVILMGKIGADFLDLPPEVLQTSMKEHQKFFSVRNPKSQRIEAYITVANRDTDDNGAAILAGNNKVLAARLSDAKFFWENDLRVAQAGMDDWLNSLTNVTFHRKLGSQADRIDRIATLSRTLAATTGADPDDAEHAARTCKADLASEMVYEFPELQGVMGRYYAEKAGLPAAVAEAAAGHYAPLGPSDEVPVGDVAATVALADKLDTLVGFWAIDEKPTGSKDPFALRRAALGVIRIVLAKSLRLPLLSVASAAAAQHSEHAEASDYVEDLVAFFHDRLKVYLREDGIRHDVIDACLAMDGADDLTVLVARARALNAFLATDDGENLLQGFRRANNILSAEEAKDGVEYSLDPDPKFAENDAEKALFAALDEAEPQILDATKREDFGAAMSALASLRAPIDAFFEATMINTDNKIVRRNRLCLLNRIRAVTRGIADLPRIEG